MSQSKSLVLGVTALVFVSCTSASPPSPGPTTHRHPPAVPSVIGERFASAKANLVGMGYRVERRADGRSSTEWGNVAIQAPHAGAEAEQGSVVTLWVPGRGIIVPSVIGSDVALARLVLRGADLRVKVKRVAGDLGVPAEIISQNPRDGILVKPRRLVTLFVVKQGPCTPGYYPCLPPLGGDYDCYGGGRNGPYFTMPGVVYRVTGSDPYDLRRRTGGLG